LFRKNFGPDGKADHVYIIKPDGGAQGKGIFLTRNVNDIPSNTLCVAQNYILNPLLIDGKKFDLRIYVLVTSCKPLRMYLFKDGLVRICAEEFARPNTANLEERCMHLTNYAVNKFNENFVGDDHLPGEDDTIGSGGNKRSISWLFEWLRKERGEAIVESLWGKIGHICRLTVLSIAPLLMREYDNLFGGVDKLYEASKTTIANLESEKKSLTSLPFVKGLERERDLSQPRGAVGGSRCFEVLGFDIMLDTKCTPILIETNHLPACK
jgi:tubulin polyglutamylase TTLL6/13